MAQASWYRIKNKLRAPRGGLLGGALNFVALLPTQPSRLGIRNESRVTARPTILRQILLVRKRALHLRSRRTSNSDEVPTENDTLALRTGRPDRGMGHLLGYRVSNAFGADKNRSLGNPNSRDSLRCVVFRGDSAEFGGPC